MKRTRIFGQATLAVVIIASLGLASCAKKDAEGKDAAKVPTKGRGKDATVEVTAPVFAVNTTTASKGQIKDYLALSGDLVAGSSVDAYSDVAGKVTKLYVSVGSRVSKGDPLAEIDPSKPGMNFVAGVAKAPISGTIVALPAELGMTISQAVPLARISSAGSLELRTYVAERFISKMRVGLNADVMLEAYPGVTFPAVIRELSPTIDPASRTMEVRLSMLGGDARLKSGMFAKLKIITSDKSGVVKIPASAVVQRFGESYVFTVETDPTDPAFQISKRQTIVPGILIDDKLEVREGLAAGVEIVVRGQTLLEDGSRINVIDRIAPLGASD
ncbi:efflux RND transporter periplasmic adaptor subunit [Treponema sp.]